MKLMYVIQVYKSMFLMKNDLNSVNPLYPGSQKKFSNILCLSVGNFLKHILTNLHCAKCNEINIFLENV